MILSECDFLSGNGGDIFVLSLSHQGTTCSMLLLSEQHLDMRIHSLCTSSFHALEKIKPSDWMLQKHAHASCYLGRPTLSQAPICKFFCSRTWLAFPKRFLLDVLIFRSVCITVERQSQPLTAFSHVHLGPKQKTEMPFALNWLYVCFSFLYKYGCWCRAHGTKHIQCPSPGR